MKKFLKRAKNLCIILILKVDTTEETNSKIFTGQIIDYGEESKDTIRTDYTDFIFAKNEPFKRYQQIKRKIRKNYSVKNLIVMEIF